MEDLSRKISELLSDPQTMEQIKGLAGMFQASAPSPETAPPPTAAPVSTAEPPRGGLPGPRPDIFTPRCSQYSRFSFVL